MGTEIQVVTGGPHGPLAWVFVFVAVVVGIFGVRSRVSKAWAWPILAVMGVMLIVVGIDTHELGFHVAGGIDLIASVQTAMSAWRDWKKPRVSVEELIRRQDSPSGD